MIFFYSRLIPLTFVSWAAYSQSRVRIAGRKYLAFTAVEYVHGMGRYLQDRTLIPSNAC